MEVVHEMEKTYDALMLQSTSPSASGFGERFGVPRHRASQGMTGALGMNMYKRTFMGKHIQHHLKDMNEALLKPEDGLLVISNTLTKS